MAESYAAVVAKAFCARRHLVAADSAPPDVGHLFGQRVVISRRGHNRHVLKILGGGADHRRPADIDVLDQIFKRHARLGRGFLEGVKIDHHHVDGLNAVLGNSAAVRSHSAPVQDAAVHLGMQGLHPPVEHLGKTGEFGNILHADPGVAQQLRGAAGRNQFHAHAGKFAGKLHQPRLVGHAEDGTLDLRLGRGHGRPRMNWECAWERQEEILTGADFGRQSSVVGLSRDSRRDAGATKAAASDHGDANDANRVVSADDR